MDSLDEIIRNTIGRVMNEGVATKVVIPLKVDGYSDLICSCTVEVPCAVKTELVNDGDGFKTIFHYGKWDADKQRVVWGD